MMGEARNGIAAGCEVVKGKKMLEVKRRPGTISGQR